MRTLLTMLGASALLIPGAVVYEMHTDVKQPRIHTDGRIWISTKSGLPLRVDGDSRAGTDKLHGSNLYSYGAGVHAPVGS